MASRSWSCGFGPARAGAAAACALALSFALGACGGGDGPGAARPATPPASDAASALEHVHGLAIAPADGRLLIATHHGLFALGDGERTPVRVSRSGQDFMGFSVAGARRFIGSGHPSPEQRLPANLGLIESRDGGRTWRSISLLGQADFHVLESRGQRVYGFDGTRLMVSIDGWRAWSPRAVPGAVFDLALDPGDAARVLASTDRGIFVSGDAGRSWRALRRDVAGLLAWPSRARLYLVDGEGRVFAGSGSGAGLRARGAIGGQPAAFMAHGTELYAALADGTIKRSTDGGATWAVRAAPS